MEGGLANMASATRSASASAPTPASGPWHSEGYYENEQVQAESNNQSAACYADAACETVMAECASWTSEASVAPSRNLAVVSTPNHAAFCAASAASCCAHGRPIDLWHWSFPLRFPPLRAAMHVDGEDWRLHASARQPVMARRRLQRQPAYLAVRLPDDCTAAGSVQLLPPAAADRVGGQSARHAGAFFWLFTAASLDSAVFCPRRDEFFALCGEPCSDLCSRRTTGT